MPARVWFRRGSDREPEIDRDRQNRMAAIFRHILHPHRQLAKMRLVVTGEWSAEKPRIMRQHSKPSYIEIGTNIQLKK
jgi:hypothetical protein